MLTKLISPLKIAETTERVLEKDKRITQREPNFLGTLPRSQSALNLGKDRNRCFLRNPFYGAAFVLALLVLGGITISILNNETKFERENKFQSNESGENGLFWYLDRKCRTRVDPSFFVELSTDRFGMSLGCSDEELIVVEPEVFSRRHRWLVKLKSWFLSFDEDSLFTVIMVDPGLWKKSTIKTSCTRCPLC